MNSEEEPQSRTRGKQTLLLSVGFELKIAQIGSIAISNIMRICAMVYSILRSVPSVSYSIHSFVHPFLKQRLKEALMGK